ncbi:MAG: hypothetical protein JW860_15910, partial [Sedimentisphaerales bacterium]|nr:hypothetical protein [Sedimentisphaerales bacterium]
WQLMYDRYVNYHGLHNLIWVYTVGDPEWYPGNDYVDIVSMDIYPSDPDTSMVGYWQDTQSRHEGVKLVALSECGIMPNPDRIREDDVWWSWFSVWSGEFIHEVDQTFLNTVYHDEDIITLDELIDWKNYPVEGGAPIVAITQPAEGAEFDEGVNIIITANASDPFGAVTQVEFFQNDVKLGDDTTVPFSFNWLSAPEGYYELIAVATDNDGFRSDSQKVHITVGDPPDPILVRYEAEDAVSDGPEFTTEYPGYSGTGSMIFNNDSGTGITFTVTSSEAGDYPLTIGYLIPSGWGDKDNTVLVNGETVWTPTFTNTGDAWSEFEFGEISLNAGYNTVRIEHFWGWIYVDYIELELYGYPPSAPTGLLAVAGEGMVSLDWNDNSEGYLAGYNVYRSTTSGSGYTKLNSILLSSSDYTDYSVVGGIPYYYIVTVVDFSSYESSASDEVNAAPTNAVPPAVPTGLVATDNSDGSVLLDWNDNSDGDLYGYNIYRSRSPGSGYTQINVSPVSSSDYIDNTVTSHTYYYVVTAVDIALNESGYSNEDSVSPTIQLSFADFETDMDGWLNVIGEDTDDWLLNSGGTSSLGTGPTGGANGSTWYVYFETSSGHAYDEGDTAYLESPEIGGIDRTIMFYFHMYGEDVGTLNVDVFDGVWNNGIWSLSGQQHTASEDPYTQAQVDLSAYSGAIRIRFRAVAAGFYHGDIAIDEIKVLGRELYGDFNQDDTVDMDDLYTFLINWLMTDCSDMDLNDDCVINLHEFSEFANNWLE